MSVQPQIAWTEGQDLPELSIDPISRTTLALFAGASGDHNPVHIDIDAARSAGFTDVFAHGMLVMAYLGRAVTQWAPQLALRSYQVRFVQITQVGDALRCHATVTKLASDESGKRQLELKLSVCDSNGDVKLAGTATYEIQS